MSEQVHATFDVDIPGWPPTQPSPAGRPRINRPCRLTRRTASGAKDERGNEVLTEVEVETVCEIQQIATDGDTASGLLATSTWQAFFLHDADVEAGDEVITLDDGHGYVVDGEPWRARNPRTQTFSHIEAQLKRTVGIDVDDTPVTGSGS